MFSMLTTHLGSGLPAVRAGPGLADRHASWLNGCCVSGERPVCFSSPLSAATIVRICGEDLVGQPPVVAAYIVYPTQLFRYMQLERGDILSD